MSIFKHISLFIARIITGVLHAFSFVLGVGIISVLYRITGRRLSSRDIHSFTWKSVTGSSNTDRMY